ncbi:hypothetical protein F8388_024464 [Cannabis sativa]|uniref:Branched-chain-amino-acid aminotransferase n=1 Tax=Cannabis sativa TaxID=3483 RepID=A0A7J6E1U8_CANSA|nr:hypothetical protein F8388_024464 [Cannabis sativa]
MDWDNLGFKLITTDYIYSMKCTEEGNFEQGRLSLHANIELSPAAAILNYAQGVFEGTKAHKKEDGGLLLFRPDQNGARMKIGAERMCMPSPSVDQFVDAVKQTAIANRHWNPTPHEPRVQSGCGVLFGSEKEVSVMVLVCRCGFDGVGSSVVVGSGGLGGGRVVWAEPLLMGTGGALGVAPAPDYTFLVYASPVANYFKEGLAPLNIYVEDEFHRASPGGTGHVKAISNYSPCLKALTRAKKRGFSDVLFLDSIHNKYVEELSTCNIFILKGNQISTPATNGTILPGVTRSSIIEIARDYGYKIEEREIEVDEVMEAEEVFCTGTAVGVASVGSITYHTKRVEFKTGDQTVSQKLYSTLIGIQRGVIEDKKGWIVEID